MSKTWGWALKRLGIVGVSIVLVALAAAVIVFFVFQQQGSGVTDPPTDGPTGPSNPQEGESEAEQVAQMLRGATENLEASVIDELKDDLDPSIALPEGSILEPFEETWAPDGIGGGTINMVLRIPGEPDEYYLVVVVEESGSWKIMSTFGQEVER